MSRPPEPDPPGLSGLAGSAALLGIAGLLAAVVLSGLGAAVAAALAPGSDAATEIGAFLGTWTAMLGACWIATATVGSGGFRRDLGVAVRPVDVGWGLGWWAADLVAAQVVALLVRAGMGQACGNGGIVTGVQGDGAGFAVVVAFATVGAPIVEEIFFRGLMLRSVGRAWGAPAGIAVQAVLFALVHAQGGPASTNAAVMGTMLCVGLLHGTAAQRAGRVGPSVVAHMCFNGLSTALLLTGVGGTCS